MQKWAGLGNRAAQPIANNKRYGASRVIAAFTAASFLMACTAPREPISSETSRPDPLLERWLKAKPRTIRVHSALKPLKPNYRVRITRATDAPFTVGQPVGCSVGCVVLIPLFMIIALPVAAMHKGAEPKSVYEDALSTATFGEEIKIIKEALKGLKLASLVPEQAAQIGKAKTAHQFILPSFDIGPLRSEVDPENLAKLDLEIFQLDFVGNEKAPTVMGLRIGLTSAVTVQIAGVKCRLADSSFAYISQAHPLDEWTRNKAALLKTTVRTGIQVLAAEVIDKSLVRGTFESRECDFDNSSVALQQQKSWKREIRDRLASRSSTRDDVQKLLGKDALKLGMTPLGEKVVYQFRNQVVHPALDARDRHRSLIVIFDRQNKVRFVWTDLDNKTAIHRVDQIRLGETTREKVLELLGEPDEFQAGVSILRYEKLSWQRWKIEVLFDEAGLADFVYVRKGSSKPSKRACEGAKHKSVLAMEDLRDFYRWENLGSKADFKRAYKWALIAQKHKAKDTVSTLAHYSLSDNDKKEMEREAAIWTPESKCP